MQYLAAGLAFGAGVPLFLVGVFTLNPAVATYGVILTMSGLSLLG